MKIINRVIDVIIEGIGCMGTVESRPEPPEANAESTTGAQLNAISPE